MASLQWWSIYVLEPHAIVLSFGCVDQLFVGIVVVEIDERFYLGKRIKPAIIHAKSDQIDLVARY